MNNWKWLKRKYPKSYYKICYHFSDESLKMFRERNMKLGELMVDVTYGTKYCKGTVIQFKRRNPIRDYNYPLCYVVVKCKEEGYTSSGYHAFEIVEEGNFKELKS